MPPSPPERPRDDSRRSGGVPDLEFAAECWACDAMAGPFASAAEADQWHDAHAETCPGSDPAG